MDWTTYAQAALDSDAMGAMVGAAVRILGQTMEHAQRALKNKRTKRRKAAAQPKAPPVEPSHVPPPIDAQEVPPTAPSLPDRSVVEAGSLLGVSIDATEDQVRAALRARLTASRIHPGHGGDGEAAKALVSAKNLLAGRARVSATRA